MLVKIFLNWEVGRLERCLAVKSIYSSSTEPVPRTQIGYLQLAVTPILGESDCLLASWGTQTCHTHTHFKDLLKGFKENTGWTLTLSRAWPVVRTQIWVLSVGTICPDN